MVDLLISTLEVRGYPIRLQGSLLADEPYPNHFYTFWNDAADGESYFDNEEGAILWQYSLNFYSNNPALVNSELLEAKKLLKKAGFIVSGAGYNIMSDKPTHTGRGITVIYRQEI